MRSTFVRARIPAELTLVGEAEAALVDAADRVLHALMANVEALHAETAKVAALTENVVAHAARVREVVLLAPKADIAAVVLTALDAVDPAVVEVEVVSRAVVAFRRPPSLTTSMTFRRFKRPASPA